VEAPDGRVVNMLRINGQTPQAVNVAAYTVLDQEASAVRFQQWVSGPFGTSKFVIRRDPNASRPVYYAVSNNVTREMLGIGAVNARNNLVLSTSQDLVTWSVCSSVLSDDTGFTLQDSATYTGFEYPDWQFDGDHLFVAIRTAYRGAVNCGQSNRITFAWIRNFRSLCVA
jgi:hypothetical protein